jgi:hypothetical protein
MFRDSDDPATKAQEEYYYYYDKLRYYATKSDLTVTVTVNSICKPLESMSFTKVRVISNEFYKSKCMQF